MKTQTNPNRLTISASTPQLLTERAVKKLAGTIYKNLQEEGCKVNDIISISSQLIDLVTHELTRDSDDGSNND